MTVLSIPSKIVTISARAFTYNQEMECTNNSFEEQAKSDELHFVLSATQTMLNIATISFDR